MSCGCVIPNLIFTRKLPCHLSQFICCLCFLFFYIFHLLLCYPRYSPLKFYCRKKGLSFELWLRDSQFNFHQKIAMLFILIYICFMFFFSFLRFFICYCVTPVTPNSNFYIFYIFFFLIFFICYHVTPVTSVTPNYISTPEKKVYHLSCGCVTPNLIFTRKLPCYIS